MTTPDPIQAILAESRLRRLHDLEAIDGVVYEEAVMILVCLEMRAATKELEAIQARLDEAQAEYNEVQDSLTSMRFEHDNHLARLIAQHEGQTP